MNVLKAIGGFIKKAVFFILALQYSSTISYLGWLFFYWLTPYFMNMGWWMFVLYVLFFVVLLHGILGGIAGVLAIPMKYLIKGSRFSLIFSFIPFLVYGIISVKIPWVYSIDKDFLQYILAVSLTINIVLFFGSFIILNYKMWKSFKDENDEAVRFTNALQNCNKTGRTRVVYKDGYIDMEASIKNGVTPQEMADAFEEEFGDEEGLPLSTAKEYLAQVQEERQTTKDIDLKNGPLRKREKFWNEVASELQPRICLTPLFRNLEKSTSALSRIPKDEKGEPMFESVDTNTAWEALVELSNGNKEVAMKIAEYMLENKKAVVKHLELSSTPGESSRFVDIHTARKEVDAWIKIIVESGV